MIFIPKTKAVGLVGFDKIFFQIFFKSISPLTIFVENNLIMLHTKYIKAPGLVYFHKKDFKDGFKSISSLPLPFSSLRHNLNNLCRGQLDHVTY